MQDPLYALSMDRGEIDESDFTATELKILDMLEEGRCTPAYIASEIEVTQEYVRERLSELKRLGLVEQVHRGLYQIDSSTSGITVTSHNGNEVAVEDLINNVLNAEFPTDGMSTFWWDQQVNIGFSSLFDPDISVQIEIVATPEFDTESVDSIDDVGIDGFQEMVASLNEALEKFYDEESNWYLEGKGQTPAGRGVVFRADFDEENRVLEEAGD